MSFQDVAKAIDDASVVVENVLGRVKAAVAVVENLKAHHEKELAEAQAVVSELTETYKSVVAKVEQLYSELHGKMTGKGFNPDKPTTVDQVQADLKALFLAGQKLRGK